MLENYSKKIYALADEIFPINRSLTGNGVRKTLGILKNICPELNIMEVPSGTKVFDWEIPKEWNVSDAYIADMDGNRIIDFQQNNLHVVGYSTPISKVMTSEELKEHVYTLPDKPDLIPYITSYYKERFGFCMTHNQFLNLNDPFYKVVIESELSEGALTYGEIIIQGNTDEEILLSTYICHPSMGNNEVSGPCLAIYLSDWIKKIEKRRYTYRIIFVPETIGSIMYLHKHFDKLKENVIAGFVITCVGDNKAYSLLESKYGNTLADKVARNVIGFIDPEYKHYSYLERGSDERQYCSAGIDLPVVSLMRSKYGTYPEYHTSGDDMSFISEEGFLGSFNMYTECILALEYNEKYKINCICEPQLGKRGLYPTLSNGNRSKDVVDLVNFIAYADGKNDLIDISNYIKCPINRLLPIIKKLRGTDLLD